MSTFKILSWNINGIRACVKKGFVDWLSTTPGELVFLQEVRATQKQIPKELAAREGWHSHIVSGEKKGYSGVGFYSRHPTTEEVITSLGVEEFDKEARVQIARFGKLLVANVYFPNGSGKNRDNSRIPYKLDFYRRLFDLLEPERAAGTPILVLGDYNTAHQEIDLARPKTNHKTSGFCPEEREELDRWLREGWVDTFRHFHPDTEGAYTWWSQRFGVRERNVGWRIDYVLASPGAMPFVKDAFVLKDVMGSDHCPVGVEVERGILGD